MAATVGDFIVWVDPAAGKKLEQRFEKRPHVSEVSTQTNMRISMRADKKNTVPLRTQNMHAWKSVCEETLMYFEKNNSLGT